MNYIQTCFYLQTKIRKQNKVHKKNHENENIIKIKLLLKALVAGKVAKMENNINYFKSSK